MAPKILYTSLKRAVRTNRPVRRTLRDCINAEAKLGGRLFGPIPAHIRREFFFLKNEADHSIWIWNERTKNEAGSFDVITTRYQIYTDRVIKSQNSHPYEYVQGAELRHLYQAINGYGKHIPRHIYGKHVATA